MNSVVPIGVALALKARRPVKLVSTREEDFYSHVKYPSLIRLKLGARKDGTLAAGHMKVVVDIGAHNTQAYPLLGCMAGWWVSLYHLPHLLFEGKAVYTNKVPACAMQGFGNPQVTFAVESMMDMLAEKLRIGSHRAPSEKLCGPRPDLLGPGPDGAFGHPQLRRGGDAHQRGGVQRLAEIAVTRESRTDRSAGAWGWPGDSTLPEPALLSPAKRSTIRGASSRSTRTAPWMCSRP